VGIGIAHGALHLTICECTVLSQVRDEFINFTAAHLGVRVEDVVIVETQMVVQGELQIAHIHKGVAFLPSMLPILGVWLRVIPCGTGRTVVKLRVAQEIGGQRITPAELIVEAVEELEPAAFLVNSCAVLDKKVRPCARW
jgi:hypothetical protein